MTTSGASRLTSRPRTPGGGDFFGSSVAIDGDTVIVGANQEDGSATGVNGCNDDNAMTSGAAYVFAGFGPDHDGDGIASPVDACPNNAPGLPVDSNGRPLRDCNGDCLVDGLDVQCIVDEILGQ